MRKSPIIPHLATSTDNVRSIAWALPLLLLTGGSPLSAEPLAVSSELSLGYDTNPAQSGEGAELAFARYAVETAQVWPLADAGLGLTASGWYRDYEADNDSYRLTLTGDWTRETDSGAGLLKVSMAGAAYRDQLVPADERDEAAVGVRYAQVLSARHTLGLSGEVRRLAYRNASLPWAGRPGSGAGSGSGSGAGRNASDGSDRQGGAVAVRRDDDLLSFGLDFTRHWRPGLASVLSATHARCDSPVAAQAYDRDGLGLALRFTPAERWRVEVGLGWSLTRYDAAPRHQEREDAQHSLSLVAHRSLPGHGAGQGELFCGIEWLDSDSTLAQRSFQQQVTQCGLSWALR